MATVKTAKKWDQELNCELEKEVIDNKGRNFLRKSDLEESDSE